MQPTSVIARDRHESTGNAESNRQRVLRLVRAHPGCTAVELHAEQRDIIDGHQLDRSEVSRRLPELRAAGQVRAGESRMCRIKPGREMLTWYAVE